MNICNVLRPHGYSAFSLTILEYVDIANLSKAESSLREDSLQESCKFILEREQYYIVILQPKYNTLKVVGSCLGQIRSEQTKAKKKVKIILFLVRFTRE